MHSGGIELTKLTCTRLEDNLTRHRGDRLYVVLTQILVKIGKIVMLSDSSTLDGRSSTNQIGQKKETHGRKDATLATVGRLYSFQHRRQVSVVMPGLTARSRPLNGSQGTPHTKTSIF